MCRIFDRNALKIFGVLFSCSPLALIEYSNDLTFGPAQQQRIVKTQIQIVLDFDFVFVLVFDFDCQCLLLLSISNFNSVFNF